MSPYPLTARGCLVGVLTGSLFMLISGSTLVGYTFLTLFVCVGLTWRRHEMPVVPFLLSYQWLQVVTGFFYQKLTGVFPDYYEPGNLDLAVTLSLSGLLAIAVAFRLVAYTLARHEPMQIDTGRVTHLKRLFLLVLAIYSINYLRIVTPSGSFGVILDRLLQLRQIPLLLLWLEVFRQNRHKSYLWLSLMWVFLPALGSFFSDFKTPLMLLGLVLAFFWEPWHARLRDLTLRGVLLSATTIGVALLFAMIWQAGVKRDLRRDYNENEVSASPVERMQLFVAHATNAVPVIINDTRTVVEDLVSRVWYVTFFSRVLDHVPEHEPYANGELLTMALNNAFMPRFLFPEKSALPSDSYYTRRFAGVLVTETNTSISIGYMAEFYADWGIFGMIVSVFGYGLLMGLAAWIIKTWTPPFLANPALVATLLSVLPFEHQFIKGLATLIMAVILALAVTRLAAKSLIRFLGITPDPCLPQVHVGQVVRPHLRPIRRVV